jgi:hypothetical protein
MSSLLPRCHAIPVFYCRIPTKRRIRTRGGECLTGLSLTVWHCERPCLCNGTVRPLELYAAKHRIRRQPGNIAYSTHLEVDVERVCTITGLVLVPYIAVFAARPSVSVGRKRSASRSITLLVLQGILRGLTGLIILDIESPVMVCPSSIYPIGLDQSEHSLPATAALGVGCEIYPKLRSIVRNRECSAPAYN